jgi:AcrR family transcriptional regulator
LESRRQEIISAARACFLRNGFHQTTTDEICREASITPGGLYHYFGSKDELIAAVIDANASAAVTRMKTLIEEAMSAETAFRQVAQFFFETMQDPDIDNLTRLDLEIWVEGLRNPKLGETSKRAWTMRQEWLEALIRRGIEDGIYDPEVVDPHAFGSLMLAVSIGLRMGRLLGEDFDTSGAMRSLFMMHAGRIQANLPEVPIGAKERIESEGRRYRTAALLLPGAAVEPISRRPRFALQAGVVLAQALAGIRRKLLVPSGCGISPFSWSARWSTIPSAGDGECTSDSPPNVTVVIVLPLIVSPMPSVCCPISYARR